MKEAGIIAGIAVAVQRVVAIAMNLSKLRGLKKEVAEAYKEILEAYEKIQEAIKLFEEVRGEKSDGGKKITLHEMNKITKKFKEVVKESGEAVKESVEAKNMLMSVINSIKK